MGNVKDEGKNMDPLFPRLHISDAADKGGPPTPPRNKMAVSQHFNPPSQRSISGSLSPVLPLSTNNAARLVPSTSSYHDASYKRSVFSSFGRSCGSTRLATRLDSYHSSGINLNISLTTVKQTIETTNCQTLCNTGLPKHGEYCLYKPQEFTSTMNNSVNKLEEANDYLVPSLSFGINDQHNADGGKFSTLSTNSHIKHPAVYQKQLKLTDNDITQENKLNTTTINDIVKEPVTCQSADRVQFSEMLNDERSPSKLIKRCILIDEQQMLHDPNIRLPVKRKSFQENMAYKDGKKKIWTLFGDDGKNDRGTQEILAPINTSEEDHGSLQDDVKIKDTLERNLLSDYNTTPEEVSQMIGPEQYCRVRRIIVQQQRVFKTQLFELHRLIKVQKILAESHNILLEDSFYKLKKSPSEDIFPHLDHQKKTNDIQKIYNPNLIDLPPPPPPTITGTTQPPWCFLPPPPLGNQWLVPIRSPSEGLVYKPYTGASPQTVGLMTPVYGMNLTPPNGEFLTNTYNIPTSYQQGISVFPSTPIFTSHGLSTMTKFSCSPMIDNGVMNYSKPVKTACNIESDLQGNSSGSSSNERKKGDELPLFPTTPMVQDSDRCTEEKGCSDRIKVIKVVPHNPKVASESAARIFEFIQEERKHNTE